ncbi:MAG: hypothetical protein HDR30_09110 [Lachnospiraceae bacterium]|nr:hypothetical protein [Lachnospiraceae bacterium]
MGFTLCYVKKSYFEEHQDFIKVLDVGNVNKQSKRTHLCIKIELDENSFYIPLRNNLGAEIRKFGRIGHSVPSEKRKNAGLDFRYVLIVNNPIYIEVQTERKIPASQYKCIQRDYNLIRAEFEIYLRGYRKAAQKNRIEKEPLYRESSLINFHKELGI